MHSYDNGIGVKVKKDNWEQMLRLFGKFPDLESLAVRADVEAIIHCQNGAAVAFLVKLYQCLTKRTIQPTTSTTLPSQHVPHSSARAPQVAKSVESVEGVPPYAKPTGSAAIREKMRDPDIAATSDETQISRKVRLVHDQHEEALQLERLTAETPERYPSLRSASKAMVLRGATKPVRDDDSPALIAQQVVKDVQIKSMNEKSLEKLRMTREAKESEGLGGSAHSSNVSGASFELHGGTRGASSAGAAGSSTAAELVQKRKPMDLLNEAVARALTLAGTTAKLEQRGKDKFESFVDAMGDRQQFSDAECAEVLSALIGETGLVASAFVDFPKDFWKFMGLVFPLLSENGPDHVLFRSLLEVLTSLGRQCVRRDSTAAALLMAESILPRVAREIRGNALKRAPLLRIVYSFVPDSAIAHIQVVKRLREALPNDIPAFIHALSILLFMESTLDDTMVDLYHYYCCIGLETTCEKLRAACLSMLVPLATYDMGLVVDLLPRLTQFSCRHAWWEVKAQLLIVASSFLHSAASLLTLESDRDLTDQIELALTIVEHNFHPSVSLNLRRIGLSYLAKNLSGYQELVPLYVDVLFSLPSSVRRVMLDPSVAEFQGDGNAPVDETRNELPIRGASGAVYELMQLPSHWDSVAVAKQIFYERKSHDQADFEAVHVLHRCFEQLHRSGSSEHAASLYDQMRDFVVLGLLDAGGCTPVALIISDLLASKCVVADDVLQHPALVECLQKLVTKNVDDIRQQAAVKMLRDASAVDARGVRRCVQALCSLCDPSTFSASLFAVALDA